MPDGADPLVVGVLHPPDLDVGALEERTSSGERPLDLRIVGYADPARVRQEKVARELRPREPPLAPAQRDDLLRYQCGAPLENLVDPARGY